MPRPSGRSKRRSKKNYQEWRVEALVALRAKGAMVGAEHLKVDRDVLIGWLERGVKELNEAESTKATGGLYDCFTKVGQNLFAHDEAAFTAYDQCVRGA